MVSRYLFDTVLKSDVFHHSFIGFSSVSNRRVWREAVEGREGNLTTKLLLFFFGDKNLKDKCFIFLTFYFISNCIGPFRIFFSDNDRKSAIQFLKSYQNLIWSKWKFYIFVSEWVRRVTMKEKVQFHSNSLWIEGGPFISRQMQTEYILFQSEI